MELYRVLLVDDEEDIRVGVSRKMDWNRLGFALVGEAENGREALEMAEALQPDVVLTDVKMPFMDGLELCRTLADELPACRFVLFSGFDEFEYAQQAIRVNAFEYILKPINAAELSTVLERLKTQLDSERSERRNMELMRSRYEDSLPVLRELFYIRLLEGRVPAGVEAEQAARLGIDLRTGRWAAVLMHIHGEEGQNLMHQLLVQQLLNENLAFAGCNCFLYNNYVAVLAALGSGVSIYDLIDGLNKVCSLAEAFLNLTLTAGVGAPCENLSVLHQSAKGALDALDYRGLVGRGRAIYIGDLEPDEGVRLAFDENDERALTQAVKLGGEEEIREAVGQLLQKLKSAQLTPGRYNLFFLELLTCLLKLTRAGDFSPEQVFGKGFSGTIQATQFPSLEDMGEWCVEHCLRIQALLRRQRTDSANRTVEEAKAFIRQHYGESDLSVERLCRHLHLSPAYFSTLFKRETGMSFTAYVTVERMEAAAEALRNTEEKTYLIARSCGYEDANYFSYVFKRHFGVTPTKYRAR